MRLILIYVILCSVHFFGLHYLVGSFAYDLIDLSYYIILGFLFLSNSLFNVNRFKFSIRHMPFIKPIIFFYIALIISSISGYAFHDQSPFLAILAMRYFSYFLLYFILISIGVKKNLIIKIILIGALIYMIVFSLQLFLYPKQIIPFGPDLDFDRGFLRIRLEGVGFITLSAFYSLNKFLLNQKEKWYIFFYFICFIFVFILGFRTLLLTFILSSILLIVLNSNSVIKTLSTIFVITLFLIIFWQISFVQEFILDSIEKTQEQAELKQEYVRFLTFDFLFNKVNVNFWSIFFGNGRPFLGTEYGNLVLLKGSQKNGFIAADLGLLGFIFYYGILSLLALINIFRIAIFKKNSKEANFIKVFFFYLIISSVTTAEIFRDGMFGIQMIALYLFTYISAEKEFKNRKS